MVIVLLFQVAVNPLGRPIGVPIPVAPVVVNVTSGDNGALIHKDGLAEAAVTVLINTVMVPVAVNVPHPPVKGIV